MKENFNDFIEINPEIENINKKTSKSQLSDGAIAPIIIGGVLAVVSIMIVIIILGKRTVKPPPKIKSQIDIYSNVSKNSQESIEE